MSSRQAKELLVFEDELFSVEQSAECPIPGYLILRVKGEETSLAQLPPETARATRGDADTRGDRRRAGGQARTGLCPVLLRD